MKKAYNYTTKVNIVDTDHVNVFSNIAITKTNAISKTLAACLSYACDLDKNVMLYRSERGNENNTQLVSQLRYSGKSHKFITRRDFI